MWCWYRVGSKDEGPGLTGVSHWVEHMNFKGTRNIPRDQVKGIIEQFGGTWNGYTWIDQTTYLETASKRRPRSHAVHRGRAHGACLYDPEDCESERTVIISELKGGENDPEQLLDIELTAAAFRRIRTTTRRSAGCRDLETMTRDDLYGHYRRYYVPYNATLVVVGDVETDDALERIEHHFGGIPVGRPRRACDRRAWQQAERRVTARQGTTAYWRAAYHAPAFGDPDFFPLLVLDAALTGAAGLNIWSGHDVPPPQRRARLYRARWTRGSPRASAARCCRPSSRSSTTCPRRSRTADAAGRRRGMLSEMDRVAATASPTRSYQGPRATAGAVRLRRRQRHRHRAPVGYFETIASWQAYPR